MIIIIVFLTMGRRDNLDPPNTSNLVGNRVLKHIQGRIVPMKNNEQSWRRTNYYSNMNNTE